MKKVQTPSYWKEEKYQPLVETVTVYGNKVLIPKNFLGSWEMLLKEKEAIEIEKPENLDGSTFLKTALENFITRRGKSAKDFGEVLLEIYQE